MKEALISYLKKEIAIAINKPNENFLIDQNFMDMGLESNQMIDVTNSLGKNLGIDLYPTVLFENQNIGDLSDFLLEDHNSEMSVKFGNSTSPPEPEVSDLKLGETPEAIPTPSAPPKTPEAIKANSAPLYFGEPVAMTEDSGKKKVLESASQDIAIVGMSGYLPQSKNIEEFWKNISESKDLISEIPEDHWDYRPWFSEDRKEDNTTYSKWGGFLPDIDKFDPLFFGISPRQAEWMDPQLRLLLQSVYHTFEDAGVVNSIRGTRTGVYVGACFHEYWDEIVRKNTPLTDYEYSSSVMSSLSGSVSYHFDLQGGSIPLDNACASSLTALHLGCQAIRNGEIDSAVIAGLNVLLSPLHYLNFSRIQALSPTGRCHTFDEKADGYVPGEGVVSVLLKPLSKAIADGDRIQGVIKGSAINHVGRSNNPTSPRPELQTKLLLDAWASANINPEHISYLEAHGTGTTLGDPIEINALKKAFKTHTTKEGFCHIGSTKAHAGHLEGAAGLTGVVKVLQMMKHNEIPRMPNFETINPYIKLEGSPFIINTDTEPWKTDQPKIAGVSSFGMTGNNAHVILEEYVPIAKEPYVSKDPAIILLAARDVERLTVQVENLLYYLQENTEVNLYDIAYTLQVSREAMEERLSFIVSDVDDLKVKLNNYKEGKTEGLFKGNIKKNKNDFILKGKAGEAYLREAIANKESESLAQLWIKGVAIDWQLLYKDIQPNTISLPRYPFAKERYWVLEGSESESGSGSGQELSTSTSKLHPLVHSNESDLSIQKYQSIFSGNESFLSDHKVMGEKVLPGVAYLELARASGALSIRKPITQLRDILWLSPIQVNSSPEKVNISLFEVKDFINYEIYNGTEDSDVIYSQGKVLTMPLAAVSPVDIIAIQSGLSQKKQGSEFYGIIKDTGVDLGSSFQGIKTMYYNPEGSVRLSRISVKKEEGFVLQPSIVDCAMQSCADLSSIDDEKISLHLPFSVKQVNIYGDVSETTWCYTRKNSNTKSDNTLPSFDIDLLNDAGEVLLSIKGLVALPVNGFQKYEANIATKDVGLQLYFNAWEALPVIDTQLVSESSALILLAGGTIALANRLGELLQKEVIAINEDSELDYYNKVQEIVQSRLHSKKATNIIVVYRTNDYVDHGFISGLLKTTEIEGSKIVCKTVGVVSLSIQEIDNLVDIITSESMASDKEVRYIDNKREVRRLSLLNTSSKTNSQTSMGVKEGGVYLITGGVGALGHIFASHISKTKDTKLILTGRSKKSALSKQELASLNAVYHSCDITNKDAVAILIQDILTSYDRLDGVLHSAGVVKDNLLIKKTKEESTLVLSPKILGAKYLDEVTKNLDLDFMVYFSSISGIIGNVGQGDYSSANAWLDNYSEYRNGLVQEGKRQGITLSINWPLWVDGGMQIDADSEQYLTKKWGMIPMPTLQGVSAFDTLFDYSVDQGIVTHGYQRIMSKKLLGTPKQAIEKIPTSSIDSSVLKEKVITKITEIVSDLMKLSINRIAINEEFGEYGFDSILLTKFGNELTQYYDLDIMPTIFYNYPTVVLLAEYLIEDHHDTMKEKHDIVLKEVIDVPNIAASSNQFVVPKRSRFMNVKSNVRVLEKHPVKGVSEGVAIVGISGRFPGSPDLNTFWNNLRDNKDLITEIPEDRWDWRQYYGDPKKETGKMKAKWGGFIKDIDKFDPLFFNISPREAELMDPQQRITLEEVYHALEDAGIPIAAIKGSNTGVFVGVASSDYAMLLGQQKDLTGQAQFATGSSHSVLVNRISYLLDLHGPSEPIDTACSSSLIAIHRAVENIRQGNCNMAIAGGVNALLSPEISLSFSQAGMLSEDGRCKTFDQSANGYVRGEGVGVVILKSLSQAEADGDRIYGVIRGTSENHGGKANTLTSPNPNAQKDLLLKAYRSAGIDPRDIGYIEAHGTGTPLGDPIEAEGLKLAFKALYKDQEIETPEKDYCGIGSVKTNIGHLEAAAGMAGVMKVLMSLRYKTLPGNVHLKTPNEYLNLVDSPFYLQDKTKEWSVTNEKSRLAGVSSFGFGGSNAHVVIEEYVAKEKVPYTSNNPVIILLSAKNEDRLKAYATKLTDYLEENIEVNLYDTAYTLQLGREAMEERLAFVAIDIEAIKKHLQNYISGNKQGLYVGNIKKDKNDFILKGKAGKGYLEIAIANNELESLAQLWTKGTTIDWSLLYEKEGPNKISLPTYPFSRERYWVPTEERLEIDQDKGFSKIHPLLHRNNSILKKQQFVSTYSGKESFLLDHKIQGDKILPGVAYLELATIAGSISLEEPITQLRDIHWLNPIRVNGSPKQIGVSLFEDSGTIGYKVHSSVKDLETIHSQGKVSTALLEKEKKLNINELLSVLPDYKSGVACYESLHALGFSYGDSFQGIKELYYSSEASLSKINLAKEDGYVLQPGLLDSALQTCMGLNFSAPKASLSIPFSVGTVNIYGDVGTTVWCYARKNAPESYDIDMLSGVGEVLLQFKDFVFLPIDGFQKSGTGISTKDVGLKLYSNTWKALPVIESHAVSESSALILLVGGSVVLADSLQEFLGEEVIDINEPTEISFYNKVQEIVQSRLHSKKATNITVVYRSNDYVDYGFISGLLRSTEIEASKIICKTIGVASLSIKKIDNLVDIITAEAVTSDKEVRYIDNKREVRHLSLLFNSSKPEPKVGMGVKEGGVYLITGGAGGLGHIFASHISKTKDTKLILTGRSKKSSLSKKKLESLNAVYRSCDITSKDAVVTLVQDILTSYNTLDGIIHSAGVLKDNFLIKKNKEQSTLVLSPKILGAKYLDEVTKDLDLDFIVYFSSIAAVMGNMGQADYASANAWMDGYTTYRNGLVKQGKRQGKTLSINWPLWADGGMQIDEDSEQYLTKKWGMVSLPTLEGVSIFDNLLSSSLDQSIVMYGYMDCIDKKINDRLILSKETAKGTKGDTSALEQEITEAITSIVANILKINSNDIEIDEDLTSYGFNSVLFTKFVQLINDSLFTFLTIANIFEHLTIRSLTEYILEEYDSKQLNTKYGLEDQKEDKNIHKVVKQTPNHKTILDKHIVPFKSGKGETIGIILPGVPGIVDGYYELSEGLREETVYGIHMVGFDGENAPLSSIESIAQHYLKMIENIDCKGEEVNLYAHSLGGVVLYELLGLLKIKEIKIGRIVLLDSYANTLKMKLKVRTLFLINMLCKQFKLDIPLDEIEIFRDVVIKTAKKSRKDLIYNYLIEREVELGKDVFLHINTLYEISLNIGYDQKDTLDHEIIVVKSSKLSFDNVDDSLGWSPYYKSIQIVESEADHFDIIKEPFVSQWVDQLEQIKK